MQEAFRRIRDLETAMIRIEAVDARTIEHDRILKGSGMDAPGLITEIALLRADVREILEAVVWVKRAAVSALIVPLGLIVVALIFRGAFPGQPLPDPKDEFKRQPPAAAIPRR